MQAGKILSLTLKPGIKGTGVIGQSPGQGFGGRIAETVSENEKVERPTFFGLKSQYFSLIPYKIRKSTPPTPSPYHFLNGFE